MAEPVLFNPFEEGFHEDPYQQYALLREHDPVHETAFGPFVLTRYDDVFAVLRDASLSVEDRYAVMTQRDAVLEVAADDPDRMAQRRGTRAILNLDPPDHTRIRALVAKVFTPRRIEQLRSHVQALVDEALDVVAPTGQMDLIEDLAFPLPFTVISEMLGMPEANRDDVRTWSGDLVKILDPVLDPEDVRRAYDASDRLHELLHEVMTWKREHPADDLLTGLLHAEDDGQTLSAEELSDQVVLLYLAGHETTVNLIGNGVLALLRHPDQLALLQADPSIDAAAVDELLRFDCPVQNSRRIATSELELGGVTIPTGTFVLTILGSANRDPEHWGPTADQLDLRRSGAGQHVSFGSGSHYCLGASLARLEGQVAVGTLVRRFPDLGLTDEPLSYNGRLTLRGLARLPLRFTPT
jgi:cytochrome P450